MIEKIRISLWDLFAYFLSGALVLFSVLLHVAARGDLHQETILEFEKLPAPILFFGLIVGPPLIGMLLEPIANLIDDVVEMLHRRVMRLFGRQRNIDRQVDELHARLGGVVRAEHMPASVAQIIDPYQWCKDYLVQYDRPTPYMAFLAKFGFYRNAAFVVVANAAVLPALYGMSSPMLLTLAGLLVLAFFLYVRSLRFSEHLVRAIYQHYLVAVTTSVSTFPEDRRSQAASA